MEVLISIIAKISEYAVNPIGRHLGYIYHYNKNIKDLKDQVEMLKDTRESVQRMVFDARRNAEDIKPDVQNWLSKVDAITEQSEKIPLNDLGQENKKCSSGLGLNLVQRYRLGRKAKKMVVEVLEIKTKGDFEKVSYNVVLSEVKSSSKISDFLSFESRKSAVEQIMDAVMDDNVNKIGVYEMGGVGKTMLVREISRKMKQEKSIDEVVMSTVSKTPNIKEIQGQLGDILGLKFEQETVEGRAVKLYKRLKMEEKILVVLDDVWEYIDLDTIGIPSVADHKGCKILFTSRDKHILSNDMCTNKIFEVKVLEQDESWNLFKNMAGEIVEESNLKCIAIQIVKECAQLPIAISTVAKALRNKSSSIWRDALNELKNPVVVNIRGMNRKVYSSLKLSYEQLESEEAKLLLLLCSMFPEDFRIYVDDLHAYTMGMGLLHGIDTLAQGRHRITKLVDDLVSSSLLLGSDSMANFVRMHDIVRDVVILIASKDEKIRTLCYVQGPNEWKEERMCDNYTAVYLRFRGLHNPLKKLILSKVQALILEENSMFPTLELSDSFFEEMEELRVLELKDIKISLSPTSFSFANLRSLHLFNCELGNVDMIGELKKLEILKFRNSDIIEVPTAISQLTQLKVLELSFCHHLKVIRPNILSKLTNLEELDLEYSFVRWEVEEKKERKNASLSELKYLLRLSTLNLHIQDEKIIPKSLFPKELNLERFKIIIGEEGYVCKHRTSRVLNLKMESGSHLDDWIKTLLRMSEEMNINGPIGMRDLLFEIDEDGSSHLKHLELEDNSKIQYFISENERHFWKALSNLETLSLSKLENMEYIIHGIVREPSLSKLKAIRVTEINKLRNLFFISIGNGLMNLKKIKISLCEMMEVVIMESEKSTNKIEFFHLYSLELDGMPRLTSFCSNIEEDGKSILSNNNPFFNKQISLPKLEKLTIKYANNLKIIWHNVLVPESFVKLKRVTIAYCNNLEMVFPSNMISTLASLKILNIVSCALLEEIFEVEESNATKKCDVLLPKLSSLTLLFDLPNLKYMWSKDPQELLVFENLHDLSIHQCPKFKRRYPVKVLQHLETGYDGLMQTLGMKKSVKMAEMEQFESSKAEIIEFWDDRELFSKLKTLKLLGSLNDKWTNFPKEIVRILHNLEELEVRVREIFVEEIFPSEKSIHVEEHQNGRSQPLRSLCLSKLPKLKHLWKESSQKNMSLLQNVQFLYVGECGRLNLLLPSCVSFRTFLILSIHKCDRLIHLLNPLVAKTLVRLELMDLGGCKRMSTVIMKGSGLEEENDEEIVFNTLERLTLIDLPRLTSFHSGKCKIKFPCLENVHIKNCPEMKVFSLRDVSTPHLKREKVELYSSALQKCLISKDSEVIVVDDINVVVREAWENDYDSRIQHLFTHESLEENQADNPSSSSQADEVPH